MDRDAISRREAGRRLMWVAAAAGAAGLVPSVARAAGQPKVPKKEKSNPQQPAATASAFDKLLTKGRSHDWTFKTWVNVNAYQHTEGNKEPVIDIIKIATAAVVFPVNKGCASCEVDTNSVKGVLLFDDQVVDNEPRYSDAGTPPMSYHSGTRLGRWEMTNRTGREFELQLEIPMSCWETVFDEAGAMKVPWPTSPWPPTPASTLGQDMFVDHHAREVRDLLTKWTEGKNPKAIGPVQLAKFLMSQVLEHCQPSGDGLAFNDMGAFRGVVLQKVEETAVRGRGTDHDIVNLLAAVYRAAGLPARTVIGYDITEKKGQDTTFLQRRRNSAKLRPWVEFCLYDEASQKELWVPADVVRLRKNGSRAPSLDALWKYFGAHDELDDIMPFAFQYHPPTTVVAHGYPAFWGWFTTPEIPNVGQALRFDCQTTAKRAGDQERKKG